MGAIIPSLFIFVAYFSDINVNSYCFFVASIITSCLSYSDAKRVIADDLNDAMLALANENSELWTRPDTIAALRQMHETTHQPIIYQATDANFRNAALKDEAYFTLALVDKKNTLPKIRGNKIASDSIMLVPEGATDGMAIQVQGFANCSMASVFCASDQTLPGIFFLSLFSQSLVFLFVNAKTSNSAKWRLCRLLPKTIR